MMAWQRTTLFSIATVLVLGGVMAGASLWVGYQHEKLETEQQTQAVMKASTAILQNTLEGLTNDLNHLAAIAKISGVGSSPIEQWQHTMHDDFYAFLQSHEKILKVRIIDTKHGGQELLRLNHFKNRIETVPQEKLQHKGDRPYFYADQQLTEGKVHVSPLNLNHDFGRISEPAIPIVRIATPLTVDGVNVALISISLRMQPVLDQLRSAAKKGDVAYLLNQYGDILMGGHSKAFAFEFNHREQLQDRFPALTPLFGNTDLPHAGAIDISDNAQAIYRIIYFDPSNSNRYWVLIHQTDDHFQDDALITLTLTMVSYILLLLLALLLARHYTQLIRARLHTLRDYAEKITSTMAGDNGDMDALNLKPPTTRGLFNNEVSAVIQSLTKILQQHHRQRQQMIQQQNVVLPLQQMEQMNSQRELRMIELKREVNALHQQLFGKDRYDLSQMDAAVKKRSPNTHPSENDH